MRERRLILPGIATVPDSTYRVKSKLTEPTDLSDSRLTLDRFTTIVTLRFLKSSSDQRF
jgi:hypothetical protein